MKHDWESVYAGHPKAGESPWGFYFVTQRRCKNCGAWQKKEEVSYDVMSGSRYLWRPLAGRCEPPKAGTAVEQG